MSRSFQEYLEAKTMQPVEKPPVEKVPEYKGPANHYVKKGEERKNCCGPDGKLLAGDGKKVEEVPDYHGETNPGAKQSVMPKKNIKKDGGHEQVKESIATTFAEYINAKGQDEKAKVTLNVNFNQPEGPTDGMAGPSGGKALPYVAKTEKGDDWGSLGSNEPYAPKTDVHKDTVVYGQDQKKTKLQPQAESVLKKMSLVEVTTYLQRQNDLLMKEDTLSGDVPTVTAWHTGKTMPDPLETIDYITHLASQNRDLMETLIRKLKGKKGGIESLMEQLLEHPETTSELAKHLDGEKGPSHAGGIARAMAERFRNYMDDFHAVNESDETSSALSPAIGFGDDEMASDDGDEEENYGDDEDPNVDDSDTDGDADDIDDSDAPDDDLPELPKHHDDDDGDEEPPPELPKHKKPSRRFSHDHLIDAMSGHQHMRDAMIKHCSGM
jgi:hypothetical protein